MQVISTVSALRARLKPETSIAFVPTMGNLHEGHLSLVKRARELADCVVVSVFVNPLQFGVGEDFASYPRTLAQDCHLLEEAGVAVVFAPSEQELYPEPQDMAVEPPQTLANQLCGASRPGHFRGVTTVVLKLFNIVQPDFAVFGKKDYQQLHLIKRMVRQLNLSIKVVGVETKRAADGLALSSRNGYLSPSERQEATRLNHELRAIVAALQSGSRDFSGLSAQATAHLNAAGWAVDYIDIRETHDLATAQAEDKQCVILAAARLGKTRLIDNLEVNLA